MTQSAKAPPAAIQHQFQAALLHVLRQPHSAQAQLALYESAKRLSHTLKHPDIDTFWQVSSVFLEAQALSLLPPQIQPQPLLVRLERQLQHHLQALAHHQAPKPELALLHELLIILAQLEPRTPALKQLNFSWGLPSVARRIHPGLSLAQQRQALRQGITHLAYQHLSQLAQRLQANSSAPERLQSLCNDALRLLATVPVPTLVDALQQLQQRLATLGSTATADDPSAIIQALHEIIHGLIAHRQTLSAQEDASQPVTKPMPEAATPPVQPAATVVPTNPLQRVLIQDGLHSVTLAQQWLQAKPEMDALTPLVMAFSTASDACHALELGPLSELANAIATSFALLQTLPPDHVSSLDQSALQTAINSFAQALKQLEAGSLVTPDPALLTALIEFQQQAEQQAPPPWDEPTAAEPVDPAPTNGQEVTPPWQEDTPASPPSAPVQRINSVRPQQVVRLPAQWVETYVQLAQTGRKEREQMQSQLSDLDYQLEQLEADGSALLAEFSSHSGYGAVSKTLMASLRSVLSLSQSLQLSSQQTQAALQQQQQFQQRLEDHIEGWQSVPLGRLDYPLQQHLQHLEAKLGRRIDLQLEEAEQPLDHSQLSAWQEPLKLLMTQAAQHGFDASSTRAELGKPDALQLRLSLFHSAHETGLTLSDDGQGIPLAPLMARARDQAVPAQALQSTPTKLLALLFHPKVADTLAQQPLPGAGAELISAAQLITALGGSLTLHSQVGVGTRYTLIFPRTAALAKP